MNAEEIIALLKLHPLQGEGGLYAETYRSSGIIPAGGPYTGRSFGSAIYYLLTGESDSFSALHRLKSDEIYHFYLGDPVEMLLLYPHGVTREVVLGQDLAGGQMVQWVVPAGVWQGSRLAAGGTFALLGTSMAPGYDHADFDIGKRELLHSAYPAVGDAIARLTRT
jgi:hypothetical protein